MNKQLIADLVRFTLYRITRDTAWSSWGFDPDFIRVDVPLDGFGPNEIHARIHISFRTSDSNGGWTTEWIVRIPCLRGDRLGVLRVSTGCDPATVEMVGLTDLPNHMLEHEIVSREEA